MPKPAPEEYFEVTVRCPKERLGELMAAVNKLDIDDVKFDLVTAIPTYKSGAPRIQNAVNSQDFLAQFVAANPTFRANEAVKYFETAGRTAGAAYTALRILVQDKTLKKVGPGDYAIRDQKLLPAPKKKAAKAPGKAKTETVSTHEKYKVKNPDLVLRLAKRRNGHFTIDHVKNLFTAEKRPQTSVTATLSQLVQAGKLVRVNGGEYELPKAAAPVEEVATNG